jgi:hypothetical protein
MSSKDMNQSKIKEGLQLIKEGADPKELKKILLQMAQECDAAADAGAGGARNQSEQSHSSSTNARKMGTCSNPTRPKIPSIETSGVANKHDVATNLNQIQNVVDSSTSLSGLSSNSSGLTKQQLSCMNRRGERKNSDPSLINCDNRSLISKVTKKGNHSSESGTNKQKRDENKRRRMKETFADDLAMFNKKNGLF